ncbi:hypothetical protein ACFVZR_18185 [Streptomyces sp. NPDC058316]|uniref:hypothetical protein n=1 Tax=unclassified Streptomyces TaxID=2593676 RepID=UPI0036E2BEB4
MPTSVTRLLPWTGADDRICLLITDGRGRGPVSRVADQVEAVQLGMGVELIGHAEDLLADPGTDAAQVRYVAVRLTEALRDAVRVAVSRGERLRGTERPAPE